MQYEKKRYSFLKAYQAHVNQILLCVANVVIVRITVHKAEEKIHRHSIHTLSNVFNKKSQKFLNQRSMKLI